jgi:sulfur-carrier protein adenylyltransferase/sulfurtransferase
VWPFSGGEKKSRAVVAHIEPSTAFERAKRGGKLVDVRSKYEYDTAHAKGARHVPPSRIRADETGLSRTDDVLVICSTGHRSAHQAENLAKHGFTRVASVNGGLSAWQQAGLPVKRGAGRK